MKKPELIKAVMEKLGLEVKKDAERAVDAVFETVFNSMSRGEDVNVSGFGIFKVAKRKERMGRNPATGESIKIAASVKPKFRPAKALKEAVGKLKP